MSKSVLLKISILGASMTLAALAFGWLFRSFIKIPTFSAFLWVLIAAVVFLALFLLQAMISGNFWISVGFITMSVTAFSLFFLGASSLILLVGSVAALGILIQAYGKGRADIKNNLTIRLWPISRAVMVLATTAIALFASFAYVATFDLQNIQSSKKALEVFIRPIEPIVSNYLPGFSANKSLTELAAGLLPAELKLATPEVRNAAIANATAGLVGYFKSIAGVAVSAKDTLVDILYKATIGKIIQRSPLVQNAVLIATALIFFLFTKFALLFVDWLATALAFVLYEILLSTGFFKKELQNVEKQVILLE